MIAGYEDPTTVLPQVVTRMCVDALSSRHDARLKVECGQDMIAVGSIKF